MTGATEKTKSRPRRKSGVIVPHRPSWKGKLGAWLSYAFIRIIGGTIRSTVTSELELLKSQPSRPLIFSAWHNRLALGFLVYQRHIQGPNPDRHAAVLVSASRDGAFLARIIELFQATPIRGSTSRRGPQSLKEMTTWAKNGGDLMITPDGPRGPGYQIQEGIISLAQLTGCPIIPSTYNLSRKIRLRTWDHFQVPLPFTQCEVIFGKPIEVPRKTTPEQRAKFREELQLRMMEITRD